MAIVDVSRMVAPLVRIEIEATAALPGLMVA
jgi:hypothetical protein